jgi:hypothetical protein
MRTTLDIDDDLLRAAKEQAAREGRSLGTVISALVRASLQRRATASALTAGRFALLPVRGEVVTVQRVRRLMDGAGG